MQSCQKKGVKDISVFDIRTNQYIPIRDLPKKRGVQEADGLKYNIIENKENIFIDIDITKGQYSIEDYKKCIIPQLKNSKNLYLSGRVPLWLLVSIVNSYDSNKIFTFQPGKGFTCVFSIDEKDLGTIVDGVNGINVNQYFENRKNKSQLPVVVQNHGLLSKVKGILANIREKNENKKYINLSIKAKDITPVKIETTAKNTFREELQKNIVETKKAIEQRDGLDVQTPESLKSNIGG